MTKAYINDFYKGTQEQYMYLKEQVGECNGDTWRFVLHVLRSQVYLINKEGANDGFVPVPYEVIKKQVPNIERTLLEERGVIEVKILENGYEYDTHHNICRKYKVAGHIEEGFSKLVEKESNEYLGSKKINLLTGKKTSKKQKTLFKDESDNYYPELIVKAMKAINECIIEIAPIDAHLAKLRQERDFLGFTKGKDSKEYKRVKNAHLNDLFVRNDVLDQEPEEVFPGFFKFTPAYRPQSSGRIGTIFQNASREMQQAAFGNIENIRNYDLRSSQAIGLIQQFELAGLDASWLVNYKDNKNAKKEYAARVGISIDRWKKCLLALLMGGYCPKTSKGKSNILGYIKEDISEQYGELSEDELDGIALEKLERFSEVVKPLKTELDKWHDWLLDVYAPKVGIYPRGQLTLKNPTGASLNINELKKKHQPWQVKAKIAAFVLQGQEAAFIHQLTLLSLQYDYRVLQNMHDGLICIGEIPQEAVDIASERSGMTSAQLELKPFV